MDLKQRTVCGRALETGRERKQRWGLHGRGVDGAEQRLAVGIVAVLCSSAPDCSASCAPVPFWFKAPDGNPTITPRACREHQHRRATLFCPTASPLGPTMPCSQALKLQSRAPMAPSASSLASLFFSETARRHRPDTRLGFFLGKRKIMHTAHLARGPWSLAGPVWNLMKLLIPQEAKAAIWILFS